MAVAQGGAGARSGHPTLQASPPAHAQQQARRPVADNERPHSARTPTDHMLRALGRRARRVIGDGSSGRGVASERGVGSELQQQGPHDLVEQQQHQQPLDIKAYDGEWAGGAAAPPPATLPLTLTLAHTPTARLYGGWKSAEMLLLGDGPQRHTLVGRWARRGARHARDRAHAASPNASLMHTRRWDWHVVQFLLALIPPLSERARAAAHVLLCR